MGSRIELAEVKRFRLEVPRRALEVLPRELQKELPLRLEREEGALVVAHVGYDSYLRFEPHGEAAELAEVLVCNDADGRFFHAVLGALMVRFGGDLDARLIHDLAEADAPDSWTQVTIVRGLTDYPGLVTRGAAERLAHAATGGPEATGGEAPGLPEAPSAEEAEIQRLLARAEAAWQEYQRLKGRRQE